MHWLQAWREKHGISREDMSRRINVSEGLIFRIEEERGFITHPLIADDIADFVGATPEQRDSMVHKKHHGTYMPHAPRKNKRHLQLPEEKPPEEEKLPAGKLPPPGERLTRKRAGRPVYMINGQGEAVAEYDSVAEAARSTGMDPHAVYFRCHSRLTQNEFLLYDYTFRFADIYDDKVAARIRGLSDEAEQIRKTGVFRFRQEIYIGVNGEFKSLLDWAKIMKLEPETLRQRLRRGMNPEEAVMAKDMRGLKTK